MKASAGGSWCGEGWRDGTEGMGCQTETRALVQGPVVVNAVCLGDEPFLWHLPVTLIRLPNIGFMAGEVGSTVWGGGNEAEAKPNRSTSR